MSHEVLEAVAAAMEAARDELFPGRRIYDADEFRLLARAAIAAYLKVRPPTGEVGELVRWLRGELMGTRANEMYGRAADLLESLGEEVYRLEHRAEGDALKIESLQRENERLDNEVAELHNVLSRPHKSRLEELASANVARHKLPHD